MIRDSDTLSALIDNVAQFVRQRLVPREAEVEERDAIPEALIAEMKGLGLIRDVRR